MFDIDWGLALLVMVILIAGLGSVMLWRESDKLRERSEKLRELSAKIQTARDAIPRQKAPLNPKPIPVGPEVARTVTGDRMVPRRTSKPRAKR